LDAAGEAVKKSAHFVSEHTELLEIMFTEEMKSGSDHEVRFCFSE